MKRLAVLIYVLIFTSCSTAFAATHTYYAYGNGYMLNGVFNALAMMYQIDGYITLLKIVLTVSLFYSIIISYFTKRLIFLSYLLTFMVVSALFVWKTDTIVIEDQITSDKYIVSNVPYGYSMLASNISAIGKFFTDSFDILYSVPRGTILFGTSVDSIDPNLSFSSAGYAAPFKALKDIQAYSLAGFNHYPAFEDYIEKCVVWDYIGASDDEKNIFMNNPNIFDDAPFPDGLVSTFDMPVNIAGIDTNCKQYYDKIMYNDLKNYFGTWYNKLLSNIQLAKSLTTQSATVSTLLSDSYSQQDMMMQAAVANSVTSSLAGALSQGDYSQYQAFMTQYGEQQMDRQAPVMAQFGYDVIPIFRNVMEIIIIAFLPIILILMVAPGGLRIVKNYVLSLIWIQMFNPIMAVLSYIITMSGMWKMTLIQNTMGSSKLTGLSMAMLSHAAQFTDTYSAIAGYLMLSVPMIATMIIHGGQWATGQLMGPIMGAASGAASMATNPEALKSAAASAQFGAMMDNPTQGMDVSSLTEGMVNASKQKLIDQGTYGNELNAYLSKTRQSATHYSSAVSHAGVMDSGATGNAFSHESFDQLRAGFGKSANDFREQAAKSISNGNTAMGEMFGTRAGQQDKLSTMSDTDLLNQSRRQTMGANVSNPLSASTGFDGSEVGYLAEMNKIASESANANAFASTAADVNVATQKNAGISAMDNGASSGTRTEAQITADKNNNLYNDDKTNSSLSDILTKIHSLDINRMSVDASLLTSKNVMRDQTKKDMEMNARANATYELWGDGSRTGLTGAYSHMIEKYTELDQSYMSGYAHLGNINAAYQSGENRAVEAIGQTNAVKRTFGSPAAYGNYYEQAQMVQYAKQSGVNQAVGSDYGDIKNWSYRNQLKDIVTEQAFTRAGLTAMKTAHIDGQNAVWHEASIQADNQGNANAYGSYTRKVITETTLNTEQNDLNVDNAKNIHSIGEMQYANVLATDINNNWYMAYGKSEVLRPSTARAMGIADFGNKIKSLGIDYGYGSAAAGSDAREAITLSASVKGAKDVGGIFGFGAQTEDVVVGAVAGSHNATAQGPATSKATTDYKQRIEALRTATTQQNINAPTEFGTKGSNKHIKGAETTGGASINQSYIQSNNEKRPK